MAPSTRLQSHPEPHVRYSNKSQVGSRDNPILVDDPPAIAAMAGRQKKPAPAASPHDTRASRVKAGAVTKPQPPPKKAKKVGPKAKKEPPPKQECSICATEKCSRRCFKVPADSDVCEHFATICVSCVQKMLRAKVTGHQLSEVELACPFPDCDHALDLYTLKKIVNYAVFDYYDYAFVKRFLSTDPSYINCLSKACGLFFSIEDCSKQSQSKKKVDEAPNQNIACPYCDFEMCLTCKRPWEWHGSGDCSTAEAAENEEFKKTLKAIGAKSCPGCGVNIQKHSGCDHMQCKECNTHFCWQCLVSMSDPTPHADTCPHFRMNAAANPLNWAPDHVDPAQLDDIMRRINNLPEDLDIHQPGGFAIPGAFGGLGNIPLPWWEPRRAGIAGQGGNVIDLARQGDNGPDVPLPAPPQVQPMWNPPRAGPAGQEGNVINVARQDDNGLGIPPPAPPQALPPLPRGRVRARVRRQTLPERPLAVRGSRPVGHDARVTFPANHDRST